SIDVTGDARGAFTLDAPAGVMLSSLKGTLEIQIQYRPLEPGATSVAELHIRSNASNAPDRTVTLTGSTRADGGVEDALPATTDAEGTARDGASIDGGEPPVDAGPPPLALSNVSAVSLHARGATIAWSTDQ